MGKQLATTQFQEIIEFGDPVTHIHGLAFQRLDFSKFQICPDNSVEHVKLLSSGIPGDA